MSATAPIKSIRQVTTLDFGALIGIALIWASAFIAIKIAVVETGPIWLATIRVFIGALIVLPFAMRSGLEFPKTWKIWALVIVMSAFNVVIPFFLIAWAEQTIDAGVTSLLMGAGPFFALIGSHISTGDDRINRDKALAVLFGFSGVVILVGWDALSQLGREHSIAQLAALGGCLCYAIAGLIIRRIPISPIRLAFLALALGSAMLIPLALLFGGAAPVTSSNNAILALIYLGIMPTGFAYVMRFYLINAVGYSAFALSINLVPVFGILLGFLILSEPLKPQVLISLMLVLTGLYFARRGGKMT